MISSIQKAAQNCNAIQGRDSVVLVMELESRGCFEKELEKEQYMLYNTFRTNKRVIPEVFDNLTHFEPTLLTKGFLYLPVDVRPPSSGRQKPACGCPPSFARRQ